MQLLEVLPLIRLPKGAPATLSYYTSRVIPAGSLVEITVNKRRAIGVVLTATLLSDVKALVRKQDFSLRKIEDVIAPALIPEHSIKLWLWTAKFFSTSKTLLFKTALPNYCAKPSKALKKFLTDATLPALRHPAPESLPQILYIEGSYKERVRRYAHELRALSAASPDAQTLILFPTSADARACAEILRSEFPNLVLYTSGPTDKQNAESWKQALSGEARLIIGTRNVVFVPAPRMALIILDGENSIHHKSWDANPKFDARDIAEKIAETKRVPLILGAAIPREETWHRIQNGEIRREQLPHEARPAITIIDTKKIKPDQSDSKRAEFRVITPELEEKIRAVLAAHGRVFAFSGRRGYAAHITCQDCAHVMLCVHCAAPLVIHSAHDTAAPRVLICHKCLKREAPPAACPECGSHRIQGFSIGSQRAEEELIHLFPAARILRIDADTSDDPKELLECFAKIIRGEYDIVIGTELALKPSSIGTFALTCVISLNQLLQQPDFRQEERVLGTMQNLLEITEKECVVQTSTPSLPLLRDIEVGDSNTFFTRDIVFRKAYVYPPFAEIIKITVAHKLRLAAEKNSLIIKTLLTEELTKAGVKRESLFLIGPVPAFIPKEKNEYIYHIILKIKDQHDAVKDVLHNHLPPYAMVDVNPKTIL